MICKFILRRLKKYTEKVQSRSEAQYQIKMNDQSKPTDVGQLIAVRQKHCVVVFCSSVKDHYLHSQLRLVVWTYNLYTEEWRKHMTPMWKTTYKSFPTYLTCGVAVGDVIYAYEAYQNNSNIWKLTRHEFGGFLWDRILPQKYFLNKIMKLKCPSPRKHSSCWEHGGKLWLFGGEDLEVQDGYLNDYGHYDDYCSNQLFKFDPAVEDWTNLQCFGDVPSPRAGHATAALDNKVWLYGGDSASEQFHDLFEFDMQSLIWTQIQTGQPKPGSRFFFTLNVTTDCKLVVHGGYPSKDYTKETLIMDLQSQTWRTYTSAKAEPRSLHTSTLGLNNDVIVFGGEYGDERCGTCCDGLITKVMLEPKNLQQLSIQMVYRHKSELPVHCLPKKLTKLMTIGGEDIDGFS